MRECFLIPLTDFTLRQNLNYQKQETCDLQHLNLTLNVAMLIIQVSILIMQNIWNIA